MWIEAKFVHESCILEPQYMHMKYQLIHLTNIGDHHIKLTCSLQAMFDMY